METVKALNQETNITITAVYRYLQLSVPGFLSDKIQQEDNHSRQVKVGDFDIGQFSTGNKLQTKGLQKNFSYN